MKISFFFAWYDGWIGYYWDRKSKLYVCLLPWCVLCFDFSRWQQEKRNRQPVHTLAAYDYGEGGWRDFDTRLTFYEWMDEAERLADFIYGREHWHWNSRRGEQLCHNYSVGGDTIAVTRFGG